MKYKGMFTKFSYATRTKYAYRYIFYLFYISGIFKSFQKRRFHGVTRTSCFCNTLNFIWNLTVCAFQLCLMLTYWHHPNTEKDDRRKAFGYVFAALAYIITRTFLWIRFHELDALARRISRLSRLLCKEITAPAWIVVWSCVLVGLTLYLLMIMFKLMIGPGTLHMFMTGYTIENETMKYIFSFLYATFAFAFLYLPISVFSIYYAVVCYDIRATICGFLKVMKTCLRPNYDQLANLYCEIQSLAYLIDRELGFLMFVLYTYNAFLMYIGLTILLHGSRNDYLENGPAMIICCITSFFNFTVKVFMADSVNKASLLLRVESKKFQERNPNVVTSYMRFLETCNGEITFSVWGIFDMKRNIILGTVGTVLTYTLLFHSIKIEYI